MPQKKITELQLKASVLGTESFPVDDTIQSYRVTGSQIYDYLRTRFIFGAEELSNLTLTTSVGSSALTIAVKTKAAADPSSSDPVRVSFRSATLTSGAFVARTITGSLSLVISSGSTLGQVSGQPSRIWVYLIDNAGTVELAASHSYFPDNALVSTTAEGGAGGADSATVMYSTTSRSNVACRCIGYIDNTQTTAGTWASAGTQIETNYLAAHMSRAPLVTKYTSGSSTHYTRVGCKKMIVIAVGGGAGGSSGSTSAAAGGTSADGNDTTFGSIITAPKGLGGLVVPVAGGAGGSAPTISSPAISILAAAGQNGENGATNQGTASFTPSGGHGGSTIVGRGGYGGAGAGSADNPQANTGGGGGGGSGNAANGAAGGGGGAGSTAIAIVPDPVASYAVVVGAGGTANTAGATDGTNGAAGIVIVIEF
jgi:hypothetical protein